MGYKGQRKSIKRVAAPKHWYLGKLKGVYGTKPAMGPHKTRQCIPLNVLLTQKLRYAFSRDEARKIVKHKSGLIKIDGKIRREHKFPLGQMDVVTIERTNEHFRILYDTKGRFIPHRIDEKEAKFKLCKVITKKIGKEKIPYITTHDGRTLRFPHPDINKNDSVKINLENGGIDGIIKFQNGSQVMITGGNNIGRIGILQSVEKHPGTFEIAHIKDVQGKTFSTRLGNVMSIGDGKQPAISLPRGEGLVSSLIEQQGRRVADSEDEEESAAEADASDSDK